MVSVKIHSSANAGPWPGALPCAQIYEIKSIQNIKHCLTVNK